MRPVLLIIVALSGLAMLPLVAGDTCLPTCTVLTARDVAVSFVPALSFVGSGSTLRWMSTDSFTHTATDDAGFCFHTSFTRTSGGAATFFVADGALWASGELGVQRCATATALGDGGFVLEYGCLAHPSMVAAVVVR